MENENGKDKIPPILDKNTKWMTYEEYLLYKEWDEKMKKKFADIIWKEEILKKS